MPMAFSATNAWTCMDDGLMQGSHLRLADLGTVIGWQNDRIMQPIQEDGESLDRLDSSRV